MSESLIAALVGAGASVLASIITLIGVFAKLNQSNKEVTHKLETHQAVTDEKIEELKREVREHNNFARRMPVVEEKLNHLDEEVDYIEKEIDRYHKGS